MLSPRKTVDDTAASPGCAGRSAVATPRGLVHGRADRRDLVRDLPADCPVQPEHLAADLLREGVGKRRDWFFEQVKDRLVGGVPKWLRQSFELVPDSVREAEDRVTY
jgi:hypothetical protein